MKTIVAVLSGVALSLSQTAASAAVLQSDDLSKALVALQALDQRVANVSFRLSMANAEICPFREWQTGVFLHNASQYVPRVRTTAKQTFGLGAGPSVLAIVAGSPAAKNGLMVGDRLLSIDGVPFKVEAEDRGESNYDGISANIRQLRNATGDGRAHVLKVERNGIRLAFTLATMSGCAADFQLLPERRLDSGTDGHLISITSGMVEFTENDDELAVVLAHELAHNALSHRLLLKREGVDNGFGSHFGRRAALVRSTEIEADRLSAYLVERAGYSVRSGLAFWERYRKAYGLGILTDPTHPRERDRIAVLLAEMAKIDRQRSRGCELVPETSGQNGC